MALRWRELLVRWREVAILVGVLFAINVAGRWIAKSLKAENSQALEDRKALAGFIIIGVLGLVFMGVTIYWGRVRPFNRVGFDLGVSALAACLLSVFIGPLTVGESPFANGAGAFFAQVWTWGGIAIGGTALGYIVLVALAADYRARQLKAFAERKKVVPKRV
ncbi:hypothetical protein [Allorhizocola rhizosphaerae]|uniref:hypothetical protein n=1 Tax=Allorhizocola rhizosphaerae TaxID=1872709 RepID=UPI000E3D1379|nr:hypothetical protein [Allorhizocola rhizosphaerae]